MQWAHPERFRLVIEMRSIRNIGKWWIQAVKVPICGAVVARHDVTVF